MTPIWYVSDETGAYSRSQDTVVSRIREYCGRAVFAGGPPDFEKLAGAVKPVPEPELRAWFFSAMRRLRGMPWKA